MDDPALRRPFLIAWLAVAALLFLQFAIVCAPTNGVNWPLFSPLPLAQISDLALDGSDGYPLRQTSTGALVYEVGPKIVLRAHSHAVERVVVTMRFNVPAVNFRDTIYSFTTDALPDENGDIEVHIAIPTAGEIITQESPSSAIRVGISTTTTFTLSAVAIIDTSVAREPASTGNTGSRYVHVNLANTFTVVRADAIE